MAHVIALVDDEVDLREAVADYLSGHGYSVLEAGSGPEFRALVAQTRIDVAILDIAMPGEDGLSLARWLRRSAPAGGAAAGIIFASASGSAMDRIVGLEIGADDYLAKPYDLRELLARVRSVIRRLNAAPEVAVAKPVAAPGRLVRFGPYVLDPAARRLSHTDTGPVDLTAAEFQLLEVLATRPNRILSRGMLAELLGDEASGAETDRRIDVRMTRLRRKIEGDTDQPRWLRTVRGEGYVLDTQGSA